MSTRSQSADYSPSDAVCAEAAAWIAKLQRLPRDTDLESGLRRWLAESAEHRSAFELANELWANAERFPKPEVPLHTLLHRGGGSVLRYRVRQRTIVALTASVALLVLGVALCYRYFWTPSYATDIGEQRNVSLPDGTRVALNTDTRLKLHYDVSARLIELERGEALFDIARDPKRPLIVLAGTRRITALGTSFVVRQTGDEFAVTLLDGKVSVTPARPVSRSSSDAAAGASVPEILSPGERLTAGKNKAPQLDHPEIHRITAWREGKIILDHTRLDEAIAEMNRYSEAQLACESRLLCEELRVTGIFRAGDTEYFAQALAETNNLHISTQGATLVLSPQSVPRSPP